MSKTLEDIFDDYELIGETFSTNPARTKDIPYLKQAILQWVADEVIGKDEYWDKWTFGIDGEYEIAAQCKHPQKMKHRDELRVKQLAILKQHGWKGREG